MIRLEGDTMYEASLRASIDAPWRSREPILVGPTPRGGEPTAFVTVDRDGSPYARIDAFAAEPGPFTELITWNRFVILGWGEVVHLVDPATREVKTIACDGYFGHLYPVGTRLLAATATELICIADDGKPAWHRGDLGIDGVVVDHVTDGVITGRGEWDPPGGWRPFRIDLAAGEILR